MSDINSIDKDTDLSSLSLFDWDCNIHGEKYNVCRFPGHYHCLGGRYGNNDLYCFPRGEEPSYINLTEFDGVAPRWGIVAREVNLFKTKWGETEVRSDISVVITRNDEDFYSFGCRDLSYGLAKAQVLLTNIQEHPLNFHMTNFDTEMIGRKIMFRDEPAYIERYIHGQCCVIIKPREGADLTKFNRDGDVFYVKDDCLESGFIWWFESRDL